MKITQEQLDNLLMTNQSKQPLILSELLKTNNYENDLSGLEVVFFPNTFNTLDLSGLCLNDTIIFARTENISLINSSCINMLLQEVSRANHIDFEKANLQNSKIMATMQTANFTEANMDNTIVILNKHLANNSLTADQLKQTFIIEIENESRLSQQEISPLAGLCAGLSADFYRYMHKHDFKHDLSYVEKVRKKTGYSIKQQFAPNTNTIIRKFLNRIANYQELIPSSSNYAKRLVLEDLSIVNEEFFLQSLPESFIETTNGIVVNFCGKSSGHQIALSIIKQGGKAVGFMIYDPSFGEIKCFEDSIEQNIAKVNKQIKSLTAFYKHVYGKIELSITDICKIVASDFKLPEARGADKLLSGVQRAKSRDSNISKAADIIAKSYKSYKVYKERVSRSKSSSERGVS